MRTYVLNRDWAPFSKGELFKDCCGNGLYNLNSNEDVLVKIPDEYLDEQNHVWRPSHDEVYYYIDDDTAVEATDFYDGDSDDEGRLTIGNYFETDEEARCMRDWLKARQRLINSGAEFINSVNVDDEGVAYYRVAFDKIRGKLHTIKCYSVGDDVFDKRLYFLNEDVAERSIKDYRSDWLTYLGVKEDIDED